MPALEAPLDRHEALEGLRSALRVRHREASDAAFVRGEDLVPTGFPELDRALAGGFPRGIIATLEGPPSSGRCTFAARLLATATARGRGGAGGGGVVYAPGGTEGIIAQDPRWMPPIA